MTGKIEGGLRQLERIDTSIVPTLAGEYRLSWLITLVEQDRVMRAAKCANSNATSIYSLMSTAPRCATSQAIGPITAATLLVEVGDPFRFARASKFARWCGTGAVALSSGEGDGLPVKHRLDFGGNRRINSVLYIASVIQHRDRDDARAYIDRKLGEGKTLREARRAGRSACQARPVTPGT